MEAELSKVRELLEMGFIQPQDAEERMAEIRQRFGGAPSSSVPASTSVSSSTPSYSPPQNATVPQDLTTYSTSYSTVASYSPTSPSYAPVAPSYSPTSLSYAPVEASYSPASSMYSPSPQVASTSSAAASCGLEWETGVTYRSPELTVENNGLTVVNRGKATGSFNIIRAKTGYSSGKHFWSVKVDSVPAGQGWVFAVGVTRGDVNKSMYVGGGGNGWAYLSNGQKLFSNAFMKYEAKGYNAGDVIGITVDFETTELRFSRNGEDLGVAFKGISGFVYPAVTVPGPDKGPLSKQFGSLTLL